MSECEGRVEVFTSHFPLFLNLFDLSHTPRCFSGSREAQLQQEDADRILAALTPTSSQQALPCCSLTCTDCQVTVANYSSHSAQLHPVRTPRSHTSSAASAVYSVSLHSSQTPLRACCPGARVKARTQARQQEPDQITDPPLRSSGPRGEHPCACATARGRPCEYKHNLPVGLLLHIQMLNSEPQDLTALWTVHSHGYQILLCKPCSPI